jgi:sugar lactone lactonase YvrE
MRDQPSPPHIFNDLALAADGSMYATSTLFGQIFHVSPELEEMASVQHTPGSHNNGITLDPDGRYLFFTLDRTIRRMELETGEVLALEVPLGADEGTDGLYFFGGGLISVKPRMNQVLRLELDQAVERVEETRVLVQDHPDFAYPTTGVVVGSYLVLVATSFADLPRNPQVEDQHGDVLIYRIPLG